MSKSASESTTATPSMAPTLALFFTYKMTLARWEEKGLIEREAAIYNELADDFEQIIVFTYGDESDLACASYFDDTVTVVPNTSQFGPFLYSLLLPLIHRERFAEIDVLKTNQMKGSWTAVLAKFIHRIPLVVRTGYILSRFSKRQGRSRTKITLFELVERIAYAAADAVISPSEHGHEYVKRRYDPSSPHRVVRNYVETDLFQPKDDVTVHRDVCTVCRLSKQKNLFSLADAVGKLDVSLTFVGDGPLADDLRDYCERHDVAVHFEGRVPNSEVPGILAHHRVFVLPSDYEGMPKALLEAMSCGMAVVGTDVDGINEVIESNHDGLLCELDADSLASALDYLLSSKQRRTELGQNARETILKTFSLEATAAQERRIYAEVLDD